VPRTLEELRLEFAKRDPILAGKYGEKFARQWFTKNKWEFVEMDQARDTMHAKLRALGGKRPDFIIDIKSETHVTTVDAKFATTDNGKFFCMPDWEIEKYRMFQVFAEGEVPGTTCEVLFMIFPKEDNGERFVWLDLSDFENGTDVEVRGQPGKKVSLEGKDALWEKNE
jgi:hypothetical protein